MPVTLCERGKAWVTPGAVRLRENFVGQFSPPNITFRERHGGGGNIRGTGADSIVNTMCNRLAEKVSWWQNWDWISANAIGAARSYELCKRRGHLVTTPTRRRPYRITQSGEYRSTGFDKTDNHSYSACCEEKADVPVLYNSLFSGHDDRADAISHSPNISEQREAAKHIDKVVGTLQAEFETLRLRKKIEREPKDLSPAWSAFLARMGRSSLEIHQREQEHARFDSREALAGYQNVDGRVLELGGKHWDMARLLIWYTRFTFCVVLSLKMGKRESGGVD
ncbi:hypothetical protein IW262DRAFT_1297765 [Armillaria fumosa]|nr:hypothetical protein IW262DRAFT_1297765 [Armillaria fumosa]